jgi:hypothetical protein
MKTKKNKRTKINDFKCKKIEIYVYMSGNGAKKNCCWLELLGLLGLLARVFFIAAEDFP